MLPKVPAWKRLGLKLKDSDATHQSVDNSTLEVGHLKSTQLQTQPLKRKLGASSLGLSPVLQSTPSNGQAHDRDSLPLKTSNFDINRRVRSRSDASTRAADTKKISVNLTSQQKNKQKPPRISSEISQKPATPVDLGPALEYLNQWRSSRESWKFNKNYQSALIKHAFDLQAIPSSDINMFYGYIHDLRGSVRIRLFEAAREIRNKDMAGGSVGLPVDALESSDLQINYDALLSQQLAAAKPLHGVNGFDESQLFSTAECPNAILRRLIQRMRAEVIIGLLADGEQTDAKQIGQPKKFDRADGQTTAASATDAGGGKRRRLNDGTAKRHRKLRVNRDDSSSESDSSKNTETSSDSSSSDDSDDQDSDAQSADRSNTSSSSLSSSSAASSSPSSSLNDSSSSSSTSSGDADEIDREENQSNEAP